MSNSLDSWRVMQAGTYVTDMIVPDARYAHPFYGYGYPQGWATPPLSGDGLQRGVFVGADIEVGDFWSDIGGVLKSLKGPISAAAGAAASEYGGPAAGPAASQLAGSLIDAAPGNHPAKQAAAKQHVAAATQAARTNPTVSVALTAAHHAVTQTAAAAQGQQPAPATSALSAAVQKYLPKAISALKSSGGGDGGGGGGDGSWLSSAASAFGSGGDAGADASSFDIGDAFSSGAIVGAFWDDVKNAFLNVTLIKPTNQFIKDNHLEGVVQTAAGVVASIYGGPAGGAAASALAPMMMSVGVDDKKKSATAQKNIQKITAAAAQHSPQMHQAVETAKEAIKGTAASYHIHHLLTQAKAGDPQSQAALAQIDQNAAAGDPHAQAAAHAIDSIHQQQEQAPPPPPPVSGEHPPGHHKLEHHIHHLLKKAKAGDPKAQAALSKIESQAQAGDPKAQKLAHIVDVIHQHQEAHAQSQSQPQQPPPAVNGWFDIVGAVIGACPYL
jgi:hypothetical protein